MVVCHLIKFQALSIYPCPKAEGDKKDTKTCARQLQMTFVHSGQYLHCLLLSRIPGGQSIHRTQEESDELSISHLTPDAVLSFGQSLHMIAEDCNIVLK